MEWPISQRVTDPRASSQQEAGHALAKHVSRGEHLDTKVTELGLVLLATSENELEQAAFALQQIVPDLILGKPQLNYIYGEQLLEPFAVARVKIPKESTAGVLADLLTRRAKLRSEVESNGYVTLEVEMPMSELFGYSTTLRSLTQALGSFDQSFSGYGPSPSVDGTDHVGV